MFLQSQFSDRNKAPQRSNDFTCGLTGEEAEGSLRDHVSIKTFSMKTNFLQDRRLFNL